MGFFSGIYDLVFKPVWDTSPGPISGSGSTVGYTPGASQAGAPDNLGNVFTYNNLIKGVVVVGLAYGVVIILKNGKKALT